jgi:hypothetical protein
MQTFKRGPNEEHFKFKSKVNMALQEAGKEDEAR